MSKKHPPYTRAPKKGLRVCEACGVAKSGAHFRPSARWVNRICKECEAGRGARG